MSLSPLPNSPYTFQQHTCSAHLAAINHPDEILFHNKNINVAFMEIQIY